MSNLPTKYQQPTALVARNVEELEQIGRMCAASGFFQDSRDAAQAMVKIAAGQELGLPPIQSMTGINVIKNRVTLSANLMAALLKKAGYRWKMVEFTDQVCHLIMVSPDGKELGPSSFSMEDAKQAGLTGGNWSKYPRNMLFARAISNAARWYAPEVLTGCYLPDELDDVPAPKQLVAQDNHPPVDRAQYERNQPSTTELPAAQQAKRTGQAPPVPPPPPAGGQHSTPPPRTIDPDKARRKWFAVCSEIELPESQQYILLGVESRKDADPALMHDLADLLQTEQGQLAVAGLANAQTMDELRERFVALAPPVQHLLTHLKDFRKATLAGREAA